jgi:hypothetical protein
MPPTTLLLIWSGADYLDRCILCKRRKSKCIPTRGRPSRDSHDKCQRCSVGNLVCKFEEYAKYSSCQLTRVAYFHISDGNLPSTEVQSIHPPPPATRNSPIFSDHAAVESSELPSPASVLSHGLSKHVIVDRSKRVLWPNILSRLREAFSLDPQHAPEEQEMVAMQAVCPTL